MLTAQELKDLRQRHLTFDCPRIELKSLSQTNPMCLAGPGEVSLTRDGLSFKMYTDSVDTTRAIVKRSIESPVCPGEVIPEDEYYSLLASDLAGRAWVSSRIAVRCTVWGGGAVVTGNLREIETVVDTEARVLGSGVTYHVFHPLEFPANEVTATYQQIGRDSELQFLEGRANRARFSAGDLDFELVKHETDHVRISVSHKADQLPPVVHVRAIEALQFVLAREIRWTLMTQRSGKQVTTRLRPYADFNTKVNLWPPISRDASLSRPQLVWDLCAVFLRHILQDKTVDRYHPLSSWLNSVWAARSGTLNALCLALSVAIEGVLKEAFPNEGEPSCEVKRAVEQLKDHIADWSGPEEIKNRARSMVGGISRARAIDRLRSLQTRGLVTPAYVDAWKKLRDPAAHGDQLDLRQLDATLDRCFAAVTLMYQLIFGAIGYEGNYTDYGVRGWPLKRYPEDVDQTFPHTDTVEEALGAFQ